MDLFRRVFFAAVLAGTVAGLINAGLQQWRLVPMILFAETLENAAASGGPATTSQDPQADTHASAAVDWAPADGLERAFYSTLAALLTGIGFAALLNGTSIILALPLTVENSFLWGLCGFAVFSMAPALGLAPELPGMAAANLGARQFWWWFAALATAAAFIGMAKVPRLPVVLASVVLIALPHISGAPQPANATSTVPAELASAFAANALGIALIVWLATGYLLGWFNAQFLPNAAASPPRRQR
jgi:cobalt transporter subunit CbtA